MKGYTLIELLVTITLIALLTGVSMAAYLTFNENRQLDVDARNFNVSLNKVRAKAVFLEYPDGCSGLSSFQVTTGLNASGERKILRYFANCSTGVVGDVSEEVLESSVFATDFNLVFLPMSGNLFNSADVTITLQSQTGADKIKRVIVNQFMGTNNEIRNEE